MRPDEGRDAEDVAARISIACREAEAAVARGVEAAAHVRAADERDARLIDPHRQQRHQHQRAKHQRQAGDQGAQVHSLRSSAANFVHAEPTSGFPQWYETTWR